MFLLLRRRSVILSLGRIIERTRFNDSSGLLGSPDERTPGFVWEDSDGFPGLI